MRYYLTAEVDDELHIVKLTDGVRIHVGYK